MMHHYFFRWFLAALMSVNALGAMAIDDGNVSPNHSAKRDTLPPSCLSGQWIAVNGDMLDNMRGGFITQDQLKVSFGIERAVFLNGSLVTATRLNVLSDKSDSVQITQSDNGAALTGTVPPRFLADGSANNSVILIQNGSGNSFQSDVISAGSSPTVIQNTLNNQTIKNLTTINASANSLAVLRSIQLQDGLKETLISSIRNR